MIKLGVLGCGNMGGAMLRAWAGTENRQDRMLLLAYDRHPDRAALEGVQAMESALRLVQESDYLLLALKPAVLPTVLEDLAPYLTSDKLIISIAAGLSRMAIKESSGGRAPVVLVMPNTPVRVRQGLLGLCLNDPALNEEQRRITRDLFTPLGEVYEMEERRLNAFAALAGCGPAYVYYFLDALIEAGVHLGFTRLEAGRMALALCRGSTALAEAGGDPVPLLREQVCSPGGATIEAMRLLDRAAVRGQIVEAVLAAFEKCRAPAHKP